MQADPSLEDKEAEALGIVAEDIVNPTTIKTFNGVPHLLEGYTFANHFKIDSRIDWDDNLGASYFALPLDSPKELILRVDRSDKQEPSHLFVEAALVKLAEAKNLYIYFTQFHSYDLTAKYPWLAVYYHGGPSLKECLNFLEDKRFSHGTAGRFAHDIVSILEFVHQNAFLLTKLDMDVLSLDPCGRNVFLSNMAYVRIDPNKRQFRSKPIIKWSGFADYAPLSHHGNTTLTQWDELEAFFYMLYEMVVGSLPWGGKHLSEIENKKLFFEQDNNFEILPKQYLDLWNMILKSKQTESNDYSSVKGMCKEIYETVGGVTDLDENYDFEVDFPELPEDELPRFVLEKTLIDAPAMDQTQDDLEIGEDTSVEVHDA